MKSEAENKNEYREISRPYCNDSKCKKFLTLKSRIKNYKSEKFDLLICRKCKVKFLNKAPHLGEVYKLNTKNPLNINIFNHFIESRTNKIRANFINEAFDIGKLLEVECGKGNVLSILNENGFDVIGINNDETLRAQNEKYLDKIYNDNFLNFFHYQGEFDGILFFNTLNYSSDPAQEISKAAQFLNEDGYLFIEGKIFDTLAEKLFKSHYSAYNPPKHVYYDNIKTINRIMKFHGLRRAYSKTFYRVFSNDFLKSISNYIQEKWHLKFFLLKLPILIPAAIISPFFDLIFSLSNYFRYKIFGQSYLVAYTKKSRKKKGIKIQTRKRK